MLTMTEHMTTQPRERRLKRVRVSAEALVGLFRMDGTHLYVIEGMPADAKLTAVRHLVEYDAFEFLVESETFPVVPEAHCIPEFSLTCTFFTPQPATVFIKRV